MGGTFRDVGVSSRASEPAVSLLLDSVRLVSVRPETRLFRRGQGARVSPSAVYSRVNEHRRHPRNAGIGEIGPETRLFRRGQGARVSRSAVYIRVNEHRRSPRNAGIGEIDRFSMGAS